METDKIGIIGTTRNIFDTKMTFWPGKTIVIVDITPLKNELIDLYEKYGNDNIDIIFKTE